MLDKVVLTVLLYFCMPCMQAQLCSFPGQTPITAIYVCGTATFYQNTPTYCGQTNVPVSCPGGFLYQNTNPNFFRFACYSSGTLGFLIAPDELTADYNWQLFDITSTNPVDIFTNPAMFVAGNWSSEPGLTGASDDGTALLVCAGPGLNTFCKMPDIVGGRSYLLMVTNQSASSAGYNLTFTGGSASITDAIDPHLRDASVNCDRTKVYLRMNKAVLCNSVTANGSDFTVSGGVSVISALPNDCSSVFGTDMITLTLDQPLSLGAHTLGIVTGSDGNTLTDICNRSIPVGETISFISSAAIPTLMDSIIAAKCSPGYIELVFRKPILCSSIAPDGSDFIITGPQTINPGVSLPACIMNAGTTIIRLDLPASYMPGNYLVTLANGSDGNTIIDECGWVIPAGASVIYSAASAVSAQYTNSNPVSCSQSSIDFHHDGANGVNSWSWDFGNATTSTIPNPVVTFATGTYTVKLTVSNDECTDTWSKTFSLGTTFSAAFSATGVLCPGDTLHIENSSTGVIDQWNWDFGDGNTSSQKTPVGQRYPGLGRDAWYRVELITGNSLIGCRDTSYQMVKVLSNCFIGIPSAFTPNGDGRNDQFYPLNALKAVNLDFRVYNRLGQLIFQTRDWTKKWDGRVNGVMQETGVYAWLLSYKLPDTGERIFLKGTVLLLR